MATEAEGKWDMGTDDLAGIKPFEVEHIGLINLSPGRISLWVTAHASADDCGVGCRERCGIIRALIFDRIKQ